MTSHATRVDSRRIDRVAFGWGAAEAVLLFVIPDVFLTLIAIRFGMRPSWRAALWATAGAMIGGLVMYLWAAVDGEMAFAAMNLLPGIDTAMIEDVRGQVGNSGTASLLSGPWQGIPYKLYAAAAGELGLSAASLMFWTLPGRLARFTLSIAMASYLRWFFARWIPQRFLVAAWAFFWLAVYVGYWFA